MGIPTQHQFHSSAFNTTLTSAIMPLAAALKHFSAAGTPAVALGPLARMDWGEMLGIISGTLMVNVLIAYILRRRRHPDGQLELWHHYLLKAGRGPIFLIVWAVGLYLAIGSLLAKSCSATVWADIQLIGNKVLAIVVFMAIFWLFVRITRVLDMWMTTWVDNNRNRMAALLLPIIGKTFRILLPVLAVFLGLPLLNLPPEYAGIAAKVSSILLIIATGILCVQMVIGGEQFILMKYNIHATDNLHARKIYTQVHIIGRTLYFIIAVFVIASILILFREVRQFGTSILASAGVVGIIVGFAAQKTIANLFAGFQLAMAQPIRLDDVVIVEGEWGNIEEITLTYVVVKIWDQRRLVVPLSYFIDHPFQNWTRSTSQLMGTVLVWVDYSLPLDAARTALGEIIEKHPLWDKRFWNLQVTDTTEQAMQIRVLATSVDSSKLWNLRCDIREKFIAFIQKNYPHSLPRFRTEISDLNSRIPLPP